MRARARAQEVPNVKMDTDYRLLVLDSGYRDIDAWLHLGILPSGRGGGGSAWLKPNPVLEPRFRTTLTRKSQHRHPQLQAPENPKTQFSIASGPADWVSVAQTQKYFRLLGLGNCCSGFPGFGSYSLELRKQDLGVGVLRLRGIRF